MLHLASFIFIVVQVEDSLPVETPILFGMHPNAEIGKTTLFTSLATESTVLINALLVHYYFTTLLLLYYYFTTTLLLLSSQVI